MYIYIKIESTNSHYLPLVPKFLQTILAKCTNICIMNIGQNYLLLVSDWKMTSQEQNQEYLARSLERAWSPV